MKRTQIKRGKPPKRRKRVAPINRVRKAQLRLDQFGTERRVEWFMRQPCVCKGEQNKMECGQASKSYNVVGRIGTQWFGADIVSYSGTVKVVDFGVARARGRLHATRSGSVKGKFAYMAPEQLLGVELDRRADIFALGIVLFEIVTGERLDLFVHESELDEISAAAQWQLNATDGYLIGASFDDPQDYDRLDKACRCFSITSSSEKEDGAHVLASSCERCG